ncbi:MAG: 16S rRNA (guanine(527)-N(7))-methyltransferase RsmG [Chitinispirillales bacterium]|jgi:16S rRNA (guanine527-N7)-methyltransferase|nr:16S rRNA (guanine(527)-N(7))-methyltransferase RsmG [Chitinispirillales bacterium]
MTDPADPAARAKRAYDPKELERLGLSPAPEQRDLILAYLALVLRENPAAKLIPASDEGHLFLRHFCDSIQPLLLFGFKRGALVLDIGSSGGFPAMPIRIFRPDITFVIVEPSRAKAEFLSRAKEALGFDNIEIFEGKAESLPADRKADYVISRGAGSLQKFAQTARPFTAEGGHIYAYKTKQFAAELNAITAGKDKDGVSIREIAQYDLGSAARGLSLVSMEFIG